MSLLSDLQNTLQFPRSVKGALDFIYWEKLNFTLGEPAKRFMFEVQLPHDLDPLDIVSKRVISVDFGGMLLGINAENPLTPNLRVSLPTQYSNQDRLTLRIIESEDNAVDKFVENWKRIIIDDDYLFYPRKHYVRDITIRLLGTLRINLNRLLNPGTWKEIKLLECNPINFESYQLGYDSNEMITKELQFTYSDFTTE